MRTPFLALLVLASVPLHAQSDLDPDKECAQAVVGFLKSKNVIGGGEDGLCISDLESLPAVNIGLGSKTFPSGKADTFNPKPQTISNIQSLKDIFAGSPDSSFAFAGYADGQIYNDKNFDRQFLGDKTTFTKTDVMNKLSADSATMKAVLAKLETYTDTEEIAFDKDPSITSLIRNHYLAEARARAVCQVTMGKGCDEKSLNGFASPALEAAGNKECGPRRRAVIQINGSSFSGKHPAKDGVLRPNFSIPEDSEERRDMQLAAGLNLFQRLKETSGSSDPEKYALSLEAAIPSGCQKDKGVRENAKDNFRMMLDHTKKMAEASSNTSLKSAIFSGDYLSVKKRLNSLIDKKEERALTSSELADMALIETAMTGYSESINEEQEFRAVNGTDKSYAGQGYITFKLKMTDGSIKEVKGYKVYGDKDNSIQFALDDSTYKISRQQISNYPMGIEGFKKIAKPTNQNEAYTIFKNYPNASPHSPSTDLFNCLSSAAAIEERMGVEGHQPMLIEASTIVSPGSNDVSIELPLGSVPKAEKHGKTYRGWVCTACNSGVQLQDNRAQGGSKDPASLAYQSREFNIHGKDGRGSMASQKSNKELTLGSMKNLSVYNISRSAFGDKCSASKSVCDCLKDIEPGRGELDKILSHDGSQKVAMNSVANNQSRKTGLGFKAQTSVTNAKDHCMFVPPVPHSCKVDPQGKSKDRSSHPKESALACQLFGKLKAKYADFDASKAAIYAGTPLAGAICKKSLPTTDEAKDCGMTSKTKSSKATAVGR